MKWPRNAEGQDSRFCPCRAYPCRCETPGLAPPRRLRRRASAAAGRRRGADRGQGLPLLQSSRPVPEPGRLRNARLPRPAGRASRRFPGGTPGAGGPFAAHRREARHRFSRREILRSVDRVARLSAPGFEARRRAASHGCAFIPGTL